MSTYRHCKEAHDISRRVRLQNANKNIPSTSNETPDGNRKASHTQPVGDRGREKERNIGNAINGGRHQVGLDRVVTHVLDDRREEDGSDCEREGEAGVDEAEEVESVVLEGSAVCRWLARY